MKIRPATLRAIAGYTGFCAAATLAASAWAAGLHEEGFILESAAWHSEVARVPSPDWPVDAWYRLTPGAKAIEVSAVKPSEAEGKDAVGTRYVRVPGTRLAEGSHPKYRFASQALRPQPGHEYQLLLSKTRFSLAVGSDAEGTHYAITYGGVTHTYLLGLPAAATHVEAIADLDGDGMPDFIVQVGDDTFLLLSVPARAGHNEPSAQLWDVGC